jgi:hypothetical protein
MIWACFLKELLEVVRGLLRLRLAAIHDLYDVIRAGAACSLVGATVIIGCGLLAMLLAPFLASLGSLLGSLDGDIGRRRLAAAQGRLELGRHGADGVMGDDAAPFFSGALRGICRRVEGPQ